MQFHRKSDPLLRLPFFLIHLLLLNEIQRIDLVEPLPVLQVIDKLVQIAERRFAVLKEITVDAPVRKFPRAGIGHVEPQESGFVDSPAHVRVGLRRDVGDRYLFTAGIVFPFQIVILVRQLFHLLDQRRKFLKFPL